MEHKLDNYMIREVIGHGSFATVYSAIDTRSNNKVAVKAISLARLNRKLVDGLSTEISVMKEIDHENVVRLFEIQKSKNYIYLVMEYCEGGDIAAFLKRKGIIFEAVAINLVRQLASALEALRIKNIIHRDLKPHNLLLLRQNDNDLKIKVADFGFARPILPSDMAETLCGSPLYMVHSKFQFVEFKAPEILRYEKYDAKADLWSVGAIMYEMIYGKPPYRAQNHIQLQKLIDNSPPPSMNTFAEFTLSSGKRISYAVSPACISLLQSLLQRNPLERISFEEFFTHSLLSLGSTKSVAVMSRPKPTYVVPVRRAASQEVFPSSSSNNSSIIRSHDHSSTQVPNDQGIARSLTSLSSSTASIIPPFARFKVGTPPSRASIALKSTASSLSSEVSNQHPSMRSSIMVQCKDDFPPFIYKMDNCSKGRFVFLLALFDLAEQQESRAEKPSYGWRPRHEYHHDLYKIALSTLLDLIDSYRNLNSSTETIDVELLKYFDDKMNLSIEKIGNFESEIIDDVKLPYSTSSLIVQYGQRIVT